MVLLVVDMQKAITRFDLYNFSVFENNVKKLISAARENGVEVIYIRHDDGAGAELTKGTNGFEIYEGVRPEPGEIIFDKTVNSPFKGTGLLEYLQERQEQTVIVVGLQTERDLSSPESQILHTDTISRLPHRMIRIDEIALNNQKELIYYF